MGKCNVNAEGHKAILALRKSQLKIFYFLQREGSLSKKLYWDQNASNGLFELANS